MTLGNTMRKLLLEPVIDDNKLKDLVEQVKALEIEELRERMVSQSERLGIASPDSESCPELWHTMKIMEGQASAQGYEHMRGVSAEHGLTEAYEQFMVWATKNIWGEFDIHPYDIWFFEGAKDYLCDEGNQVYLAGHNDAFMEFGDPACYDHNVELADWQSRAGAFRDWGPHPTAPLAPSTLIRSRKGRWAGAFEDISGHREAELRDIVAARTGEKSGLTRLDYLARATVADVRKLFNDPDLEVYL